MGGGRGGGGLDITWPANALWPGYANGTSNAMSLRNAADSESRHGTARHCRARQGTARQRAPRESSPPALSCLDTGHAARHGDTAPARARAGSAAKPGRNCPRAETAALHEFDEFDETRLAQQQQQQQRPTKYREAP